MVAQTLGVGCAASHIRPFSLRRDLADLADLVETAFGDELAATGSHMVEEMRQMAALGPLLHLAYLGWAPIRGYVWLHQGRVVGNVSLACDRERRWTLSNVAVRPEMRGQGIAGCLVDMAIEHVRQRGGKQITLQVLSDNPSAHALYTHRGLATYDTIHELQLGPQCWPLALRASHPLVRPLRQGDAPWLRDLMRASTPPSAHPYQQLGDSPARAGLWKQLLRALELFSQPQERIGLVAVLEDRPVGLATATLRLLASWHEVRLYVAPADRGAVERPLLEALLARLDSAPRRDVRATVSTTHPEAIAALHYLGFETQRVLDQMGRFL
jgi:ribosomal protein S18 acetylase RimI-like enzyme